MSYTLMTEEQKELTGLVRDVLEKELAPRLAQCEKEGRFPMEVHDILGDIGLHGLLIPEEYGGLGLDSMTTYLIREEMGKVDAGFGFSYCTGKGTAANVLKYGTEEQKKFFCDRLLNGGFGATCITEADAGSDVTSIRTTAKRVGDEYIINGTKCFITNAPLADVFQVLAYTDKEKGTRGMSLFLVEKERGVKIGKKEDKMGIRLSETSDVIFEDVKIPASNLIGKEGEGYKYILSLLATARIMNMAFVVGTAQHALDLAAEYAKTRMTWNKPIKDYQGISFMLADMEIQLQAARQYLLYGIRQMEAGENYVMAASGAKVLASEAAMKITTDAVQIFGGYGYSREYPVEKLMRDAKIFSIFEGTNQIQKMIIGKALTK